MIVWRISNHATLDGGGGLRASGRWHSKGKRIVYCTPNPATALLEIFVHLEIDLEDFPISYRLHKIEIPDDISFEAINPDNLPLDWKTNALITRRLGNAWLATGGTALLFVPCAVVAETTNILINPAHPQSSRIRTIDSQEHPLDRRLLYR